MSNVGVCENPVILKRVRDGITIAKTLNLWVYAYEVEITQEGWV